MFDQEIQYKLPIDRDEIKFPLMVKVRQQFNTDKIEHIGDHISREYDHVLNMKNIQGKRIGITVGSRGITGLTIILRKIIEKLQQSGAEPFIIPSMGSHGGATAEGQKGVLKKYGITEASMGIPILSSMEVELVGHINSDVPVYCDKNAIECDGVIVLNKIKPHADFKAQYESGLVKMMAIGLGKHKGASSLHKYGFQSFGELLPQAAKIIAKNVKVLFGVAIVENAYDEPCIIEFVKEEHLFEREKELLEIAKKKMPRILIDDIDVLVIEEIGKNISGEGMDPNVTGRPGSYLTDGFDAPNINKIIVLSVTEASLGNGAGIGMADITVRDVVAKLDFGAMYTNAITATILGPARLPMIANTKLDAIAIAMQTCSKSNLKDISIVWIKNTLELDEMWVSKNYLPELSELNNIIVTTSEKDLVTLISER